MVFEETCYKYVYVFSWYLPSLLLCLHVFALFSQSMHPYFQPFSSNYLKGDDFITSLRKTQFQLLSLTDSLSQRTTTKTHKRKRGETLKTRHETARRGWIITFTRQRLLAALYTLVNILPIDIVE